IKSSIGGAMYFSPQCVAYRQRNGSGPGNSAMHPTSASPKSPWLITCAAGRSYAMITADGLVRLCRNTPEVCGDLRESGYDFAAIWNSALAFLTLRDHDVQCGDVRQEVTRARGTTAPAVS